MGSGGPILRSLVCKDEWYSDEYREWDDEGVNDADWATPIDVWMAATGGQVPAIDSSRGSSSFQGIWHMRDDRPGKDPNKNPAYAPHGLQRHG